MKLRGLEKDKYNYYQFVRDGYRGWVAKDIRVSINESTDMKNPASRNTKLIYPREYA